MATALITGASGGIGLELARCCAHDGIDVILVARSTDRLNSIKKELEAAHTTLVRVISLDLSRPGAVEALLQQLPGESGAVDYLINNAGFGTFGFFDEIDWKTETDMIQLNIVALTELTRKLLPGMKERGRGRILNVASTAAFQPGPLMAVYYATKSYVLHLSEALANELKGSPVTVTALCPGPTASGFQQAAAMESSGLVKGKMLPTSKEVAEYGYRAMQRGKTVAVHGVMNKLLVNGNRFTPRAWVTAIVRWLSEAKGK